MDMIEFQIDEGVIQTTMSVAWPSTLCRDIALEGDVVPVSDILSRYGLCMDEYEEMLKVPAFRLELSEWHKKVLTEGYSFKLKMQALCAEFVHELHQLGTDRMVSPQVRLDAIKTAARLAHYEPKDNANTNSGNIPQVNIQINM